MLKNEDFHLSCLEATQVEIAILSKNRHCWDTVRMFRLTHAKNVWTFDFCFLHGCFACSLQLETLNTNKGNNKDTITKHEKNKQKTSTYLRAIVGIILKEMKTIASHGKTQAYKQREQ